MVPIAGLALRGEEFEAIAARTSAGYIRKKLPDGSLAPETYFFGKGGYWSGPLFDTTIDKMEFLDIARPLVQTLATQAYLPSQDPASTQLLIMVYWGTTYAPEKASESNSYNYALKKAEQEKSSNQDFTNAEEAMGSGSQKGDDVTPSQLRALRVLNAQDQDAQSAALGVVAMENRFRDQANARNASMLGYDSEFSSLMTETGGPVINFKRNVLLAELEEYRYFVVLMAYDYQMVAKKKVHKLLWEARLSIRQHDHAFNQALPAMLADGAIYFGRDSHGLIHAALPNGKVDIGGIRDLGTVPDPGPATKK